MAKVKRTSGEKASNASGKKKHIGVHPGSTTQNKTQRQQARSQKRGGPGARVVGEKMIPDDDDRGSPKFPTPPPGENELKAQPQQNRPRRKKKA